MTVAEMIEAHAALQSWMPAADRPAFIAELAEINSASGIPFCPVCADWHTPDDEHSATLIA